MAVTRLKRKGLRNKLRAKERKENIKSLTHLPPIKNVDIEQAKEEFAKKSGKTSAKKEKSQPEAKADAKKDDTTAVEKEPAKVQTKTSAKAEQEDTAALEKEPAKAQVRDTKAEDTPKEKK